MTPIVRIDNIAPVCSGTCLDAFARGADAVLESGGQRVALWWSDVPPYAGGKVGCVGGMEVSDIEVGSSLLDESMRCLGERGCTVAIGPMDGNTWRTHRAVVASSGRPPFLLEPATPPLIAAVFRTAGFAALEHYTSSSVDLSAPMTELRELARRIEGNGVTIRSVKPARLGEELATIHELSLRAFRANFLYTPLSQAEFVRMYEAFGDRLVSEFVQLAECSGKLVGFVFACPDFLSAKPIRTLVVKTLAVLPDRKYAGLGTLLVDRVQREARLRGFVEAIHALQRQDNQSLRISCRFGAEVFREYALFSKRIVERAE